MKNYVAIIDYQMSNLYSVKHACDSLRIPAIITSDQSQIMSAKSAILPGVGAFGNAMSNLKRLSLIKPIHAFIHSGRKFMGICLGLQLLFETSSEFGIHNGLGIVSGDVVLFPKQNHSKKQVKIPQIGWNTIYTHRPSGWSGTPLSNVQNNDYMYFVHSYIVKPKNKNVVLSLTSYEGIEYCSSLIQNNVFAAQFHPEKSGKSGVELYRYCVS